MEPQNHFFEDTAQWISFLGSEPTTSLVILAVTTLFLVRLMLQYLRGAGTYEISPKRVEKLQEAIRDLQKRLSDRRANDVALSDAEKQALVDQLKSEVQSQAADDILNDIEAKMSSRLAEASIASKVEEHLARTLQRLNREVGDLGRRGNLNLVIGIITTIIGLLVLGYVVFQATPLTDNPKLVASYYLPRLSLIILIELFAYFFLNLYKSTLSEIKYFQNEATNVEAKHAALHFALRQGNAECIYDVVRALAQTERNFVLKRGETTVELERGRLNHESNMGLTKTLSSVLEKNKR